MSEHELWNELGNLHYMHGSQEQAIQAYYKAIKLNSEYGKPYSNLALIFAKQAKYEDAILLYKRSLDLLENNEEKAITWNRLGNVYRHLKEYQEAVWAFQHADEIRANMDEWRGQSDQILYVASESEALPYEEVREQFDYQNHPADYLHELEPEFDEHLPLEWVPLEAEMLVNEIHHDTLSNWVTGNVSTQMPIHPIPSVDPSVSDIPETANDEEISRVELEPIDIEDLQGQISSEEFMSGEEVQELDSNVTLETEAPLSDEDEEVVLDEVSQEITESATHPEDAAEAEVVSSEPIAQGEDNAEALPEELTSALSEEARLLDSDLPVRDDRLDEPVIPTEEVMEALPAEGKIQEVDFIEPATQVNDLVEEEEKLTQEIEINPRSATTWEALGTLYKTAGRYEEAIQAFQQAIAIAPDAVSSYHNLGLVYSALGDNDAAFATFKKVLRLDPNHSLTHASLGGYYKKLGLDELAQTHIGKAMKYIYESENEYNRACLDAICGNIDQAIELLQVALENKQTYVDWVLHDPDLDSLRGDERFKQLIAEFSK